MKFSSILIFFAAFILIIFAKESYFPDECDGHIIFDIGGLDPMTGATWAVLDDGSGRWMKDPQKGQCVDNEEI